MTYRAILGRKQVGLGLSVVVGVKIDGHADDRATSFEEAVVALPEVIACHMVAGEVDSNAKGVLPARFVNRIVVSSNGPVGRRSEPIRLALLPDDQRPRYHGSRAPRLRGEG